ncbi:MAG: Stk1 family PASTA domain-containing Ser/Thr kinase [Solirubrobacteraceae bacterium]
MTRIAADAVIDGRYRVIGHLGTGGMAEVYCAHDLQLERKVALKLLHDRFAQDDEFVERFRREASSAAGLQHQYVVSVYDRGEYDGTPYIAMEYVAGRTLKALVQESGPLDPARAADLTVQILRAARFAHRRGVIHRDFKPQNVIVDDDGRAKVTDFGIARAGASDMTQTGSIMGTAQYLSPEQAQGHAVNARSDLYSIGIILYELLTGRVPFDAESAVTVALKQVSEAPLAPSRLNPAVTDELEWVVLRALAKDPAERFVDADEFIAALEAASSRIPSAATAAAAAASLPATNGAIAVAAPPPAPARWGATQPPAASAGEPLRPPGPLAPPRRSKRWPWIVAGVIAVSVIAALVVFARPSRVQVPNVVGSSISVATQRLRSEGFEVVEVRDNSDKPRNRVVGQDPAGGATADEGSQVTLNVSEGQPAQQVPDVVGAGRRAARQTLTDAGFKVKERPTPSDSVKTDRVIAQTPSGDSRGVRGQSVTLDVSTGPQRTGVPGVVGRTQEQARTAIEAAGFRVTAVGREDDEQDPGTVLEQNPASGVPAARGSTVTITVAEQSSEVSVPDVVGRSQNTATETLSGRGLKVVVEEAPAESLEDDEIVQAQSPDAEEKVDRGSSVTITVGVFDPDLDPDPAPAPAPDPAPAPGKTTPGPAAQTPARPR